MIPVHVCAVLSFLIPTGRLNACCKEGMSVQLWLFLKHRPIHSGQCTVCLAFPFLNLLLLVLCISKSYAVRFVCVGIGVCGTCFGTLKLNREKLDDSQTWYACLPCWEGACAILFLVDVKGHVEALGQNSENKTWCSRYKAWTKLRGILCIIALW